MLTTKYRIRFLAGVAAITMFAAVDTSLVATAPQQLDIPQQNLSDELHAIARATGRDIMFASDDVGDRPGKPIHATMTADQAIDFLLEDSDLVADHRPDGILIRGRPAKQAEMGASAPASPEILVTGTRIRGAPVASPVIRLTQEDILNAGQSTIAEVVQSIPQNSGGGQNPQIGNNVPSANGVNVGSGTTVNLRGLGPDATLTLVNGHRLAYNASRQGIDVSTIPVAALDRIEIVADGSSALYGSDAVAGVANIVLKKDFNGVATSARLGAATDGGDEQQEYSIVAGRRWTSGGFMVAYDFEKDTAIVARERSYVAERSPGLTLLPALERHSVVVTGHQDILHNLSFDIDSFYNWRKGYSSYSAIPGEDYVVNSTSRSKSFVIAPSLTLTLPDDWRVQIPGMFAIDRTQYGSNQYFNGDLVVPVGGCYCNKANSIELSADGPIFHMPGGAARIAIGGGYRTNRFHGTQAVFGELFTDVHASQDVGYLYGELNLPIVGPDQDIPFVNKLNLSGAARWEDYRGIDKVLTPKIGLIYSPSADLDLKASWGRSFKAPTLYQLYSEGFAFLRTASSLGGEGLPASATALLLTGGNPDLKPERSRNYSITAVLHPTALPNGRIELSYFNVRYRDRVVEPITYLAEALSSASYADLIDFNPSVSELNAARAGRSFENDTTFPDDPSQVAAIVNDQYLNVSSQLIHGFDLAGSYKIGLSDSQVTLSGDASYLHSSQKLSAAQPSTQLAGSLFNPPHFRARVGATWVGHVITGSAFVNYIGGVDDVRSEPSPRVGSMTTLDLAFRYRATAQSSWAHGLELSLAVQNLLNAKPKIIATENIYDAPYDTTNYSAIGRFASFTVSKRW